MFTVLSRLQYLVRCSLAANSFWHYVIEQVFPTYMTDASIVLCWMEQITRFAGDVYNTVGIVLCCLVLQVPATKEVLSSLPNVFSALCLNSRGLDAFVRYRPFDRLFRVLFSPDYLPAMRRRRNSDPPGTTVCYELTWWWCGLQLHWVDLSVVGFRCRLNWKIWACLVTVYTHLPFCMASSVMVFVDISVSSSLQLLTWYIELVMWMVCVCARWYGQ